MNTSKSLILFNIIFLIVVFFFSCKKEEERIILISNDSITDVSHTTAIAFATIIDPGEGIKQHGHCWSTDAGSVFAGNENTTENGPVNTTGSYNSTLTSLLPGESYYVRAYITQGTEIIYANKMLSFSTLSIGNPVVTTGTVTMVTTSRAKVNGTLNNPGTGASSVIQHGHCWSSETTTPVIEDNENKTSLGPRESTGDFESQLVGLSANTIYYVRAYATNGKGTAYGDSVIFTTYAEIPVISWEKTFGGSMGEAANSIQQTSDGGYIIAGSSLSGEGDITENKGNSDYWIVKLTSSGNIDWQRSVGGSGNDGASSIHQTTDGGYIIAGYSGSNDGDVTGNNGEDDYWIVKLTSSGNIDWQKSLGGSGNEWAYSIQQTIDGGYIIAGSTLSDDGDVSVNNGTIDCWIVKLTSSGNIDWQKSFGGSIPDYGRSVQQTTDGGYIIAGSCESNDGDISGNHGYADFWIIKLTSSGNINWQKSLGGSDYDRAYSIQQTTDGGYIIAGWSRSDDGDITENKGTSDCWIVKLTSSGDIDWQRSLGGSGDDEAYSIQQTSGGGYLVAGLSNSNDDDVTGNHGDRDYWIVKLTPAGNIEWQKSLGGSGDDEAYSIQHTTDGGYIISGRSYSNDGDVSGNHGNGDYWIIKIFGD